MRMAVTLYLLTFTIAGQGLCCCTLEQLARDLVSPVATEPTMPRPAQKPCCAHHHRQTETKSPTNQKPQSPEPCPCKQHGQLPVLAPQSAARTLLDLQPRHSLDSGTTWLACGDVSELAPPPSHDGRAGGFVTAEDLLRAFHILRC
jgi:hypothetical protein